MGQDVFDFFKERMKWEREAIMLPNGKIIEARPSHLNCLISLSGKTPEVIYDEMPITSSPIHWMVEYVNCIAIWEDFVLAPSNMTKDQEKSLKIMIENNLIQKVILNSLSTREKILIEKYKKEQ